MKMIPIGIAAAAIAVAGCSSQPAPTAHAIRSPAARSAPYSPIANGRTIFDTGRDIEGHPALAASRPLRPSCAKCHGANGAGGLIIADHAVSADLRYRALVTNQKPPYTLGLLERAISAGIDNNGQPLNRVMPHWKMSSRDLRDIAAYVLTLR